MVEQPIQTATRSGAERLAMQAEARAEPRVETRVEARIEAAALSRPRGELGALRPEAPQEPRSTRRAEAAALPNGRFTKAMHAAGAITSVALIAGLAVWAYKLAVRDVTGIPVIQALEGPARIAPEEPGGVLARHTGLSVNEVAADGTAAAPADTLALAPRAEELGDEAVPMAALRPLPRAELPAELATAAPGTSNIEAADAAIPLVAEVAAPVPDAVVAPAALVEDPESEEAARLRAIALAEQMAAELASGVQPLAAEPLAAPAPEAGPDVIAAAVPGVTRSPRPLSRPQGSGAVQQATTTSVPRDIASDAVSAALVEALAPQNEGAVREVDPESLALGTKLVQLGAFDDPETARREWDAVSARFDALMLGKGRVIQKTESAGRTFYRLRVEGFADDSDARRFCAALLAEGTACIAAQVR